MSNLVVKMMSGEDLPDENTSKGFTLVEAFGEVRCVRDLDGKPRIEIPLENNQTAMYHPEGNTYLLKNGKTVASFSYHTYVMGVVRSITREMDKAQKYLGQGNCIFYASDIDKVDTSKYIVILPGLERIDAMLFIKGCHYSRYDEFLHPEANKVLSVYQQVPPRIIQVNRHDILDLYASEEDYSKRPAVIALAPELGIEGMSFYSRVSDTNVWNSIPDAEYVKKSAYKLTHRSRTLGDVIKLNAGELVIHVIDIPALDDATHCNFIKAIDAQMRDHDFTDVGEIILNDGDEYPTKVYRKN